MPTCFRPYPGELLYSWIIRLYNSNGYPTVYKMYLMVCRHVFGTMKGERKNDFIRRTISFPCAYVPLRTCRDDIR